METPSPEELLMKVLELQESHERLKQEMSRLKVSAELRQRSHLVSPHRPPRRNISDGAQPWRSLLRKESRIHGSLKPRADVSGGGPSAGKFTNQQYFNVLQSMAQAVHAFDLNLRVIFWNAMAEKLYGHSAAEVVGRNPIQVIVDERDAVFAMNIVRRCSCGETWTGEFPVKGRTGEIFLAVTTCSPFYDDEGSLIGIVCMTSNTALYMKPSITLAKLKDQESETSSIPEMKGAVYDQPIQVAIASKISDLASKASNKLKSKMRADNNSATVSEGGSGDSHYSDHGISGATLPDHRDEAASSGASTPKGDFIHSPFGIFTSTDEKFEINKPTNFMVASSSSSSSVNVNSTSSASSCGSTSSSVMNKVDIDSDCLEYEILWDDLTIGEQVGKGSCGTVYRGLWFASDVAVKVFSKQEYSDEVIQSFKQEVLLMKRLRHPNVLLFMGAVTSPQRLCIVSEYLPRGSLFRLLQRSTSKLGWRRRIQMALDIARGMNYLHCCSPPIIHRDLKSSNLLVDRNWTVKVADFGLSRIKHETYLTTKSGKGTPQWMAPEVLRNESADEKSDIYSFGVVLWELATQKVPWETLNSMQVIGAVGFMDKRLEIPMDIDPRWISLMESCWHSDTKLRPTFQELMEKLRDLQRKYTLQSHANRTASLLDNPLLKDN